MRTLIWPGARLAAGAAILAVLVYRLGAGPFVAGLGDLDARALILSLLIGALTTTGAAWRWRRVADGLGIGLRLPDAVAACYRAQFLNAVLPAGVLGDVHRAVRHGRDVGDVGRAARAVCWERAAGQSVQVGMALVVLLTFPSPVPVATIVVVSAVAVLIAVAVAAALLTASRVAGGRRSRAARIAGTVRADLAMLCSRRRWPGVVVVSALIVAGHCAMFLIAVRTSGTSAPTAALIPLAMIVLLSMAIPANIAGWGPREGVAAWAFAAAGLGAASGLTVATVYGVLVVVSTAPGAAVLVAHHWHRNRASADRRDAPVTRTLEEVRHG